MQRQKQQRRQQQLDTARSSPSVIWQLVSQGWLRCAYAFADHTRNALILSVFAFKVSCRACINRSVSELHCHSMCCHPAVGSVSVHLSHPDGRYSMHEIVTCVPHQMVGELFRRNIPFQQINRWKKCWSGDLPLTDILHSWRDYTRHSVSSSE